MGFEPINLKRRGCWRNSVYSARQSHGRKVGIKLLLDIMAAGFVFNAMSRTVALVLQRLTVVYFIVRPSFKTNGFEWVEYAQALANMVLIVHERCPSTNSRPTTTLKSLPKVWHGHLQKAIFTLEPAGHYA